MGENFVVSTDPQNIEIDEKRTTRYFARRHRLIAKKSNAPQIPELTQTDKRARQKSTIF